MPNDRKQQKVNDLKEKLAQADAVILTEYHGLDANRVNELRAKIAESGADMVIAKNTLLKIALKEQNISTIELDQELIGPTAAVFAKKDYIATLKTLFEYAKGMELPKIKAGIIAGEYASSEKIRLLSTIPSKDELLARIVCSLKSPLNKIVNVLGSSQRNFAFALKAIADKKAEEV